MKDKNERYVTAKLSQEEFDNLTYLSKILEMSKSDTIRVILKTYKKQNKDTILAFERNHLKDFD